MRNSQVAEAMGKKYSPFMRDTGRLPVFCVSNSAYMKNIGGYSPTNPPRIGAHATGIPSLRANLLCLPARRKFEYFKHYCQIKLPSLLNSIEIAFNGGLLKEHEDLQDIILPKQNVSYQFCFPEDIKLTQQSIPEDVESVFTSLLKDDLLVGIRRIGKCHRRMEHILLTARKKTAKAITPGTHNRSWHPGQKYVPWHPVL